MSSEITKISSHSVEGFEPAKEVRADFTIDVRPEDEEALKQWGVTIDGATLYTIGRDGEKQGFWGAGDIEEGKGPTNETSLSIRKGNGGYEIKRRFKNGGMEKHLICIDQGHVAIKFIGKK